MSNVFRLTNYLNRIGYDGPIAADLATLSALHTAHVNAIPFEGFDPLLGRPVKLDLASLQDKLIESRRGGYCFEQNLLFQAALEQIGFDVTGLTARVRWMSQPEAPLGPREHMVLKIDLPEGAFLADVGFGACVMDTPLRLQAGVEQKTAMGTFLLTQADGLFTLSAKQPEGWRVMYAFDLAPQVHADYELGNWYASTSPAAPFVHVLIMERLASDKRYKLFNHRLTIEARDGEVVETRLIESAEAFGQVLADTFNVVPPTPVEDIFSRFS